MTRYDGKSNHHKDRLVALCRKNGWYMVDWHGHFKHHLCILKREGKRHARDIYTALMDEYVDFVGDDSELYRIDIGCCIDWGAVLAKVVTEIKPEEVVDDGGVTMSVSDVCNLVDFLHMASGDAWAKGIPAEWKEWARGVIPKVRNDLDSYRHIVSIVKGEGERK